MCEELEVKRQAEYIAAVAAWDSAEADKYAFLHFQPFVNCHRSRLLNKDRFKFLGKQKRTLIKKQRRYFSTSVNSSD